MAQTMENDPKKLQPFEAGAFTMFAIYEHPADYPHQFVVRKWLIVGGQKDPVPSVEFRLAATLDEARGYVPAGMTPVARHPTDKPCIVETWI